MCSPVQLHGCVCVCVFALACHSLKDDHSIVNKQDICLKSCITSGEDSQERRHINGAAVSPWFHRKITALDSTNIS